MPTHRSGAPGGGTHGTRCDRRAPARREGAYWGAPEGPGSDIVGREDRPAVHISYNDALAYCAWAGARLHADAACGAPFPYA
ncbi:SUMF1/EgtB/PvdO family nonheme iron enzyme [Streptomyces acidicola]|uniref:SUMF1/EgtB/PvdO family nonheme iron enzyme n=1 Tax=Streptomyces acidicola TaxID=2596892 RepID=UPI003415299B